MRILALEIECDGATPEAFAPHLEDEARALWALQQSGFVREAYFRADRHAAVLVLEGADVEEASRLLSTLPLVARGLIRFDLVPLKPYSGYARLFR